MAFKINTHFSNTHQITQTTQKKENKQPKPAESIDNTLQSKHKTTLHKGQNLLDKYTQQDAHLNTQNTLNKQFGIQENTTIHSNNQSLEENLLLEFLKEQNTALNSINDLAKTKLDLQNSQDLEEKIKELLKDGANDDFLNLLLQQIQKS